MHTVSSYNSKKRYKAPGIRVTMYNLSASFMNEFVVSGETEGEAAKQNIIDFDDEEETTNDIFTGTVWDD